MEPFMLDVFISKCFVSASLTHKVTSKQVAVVDTNSKDIKVVLRLNDILQATISRSKSMRIELVSCIFGFHALVTSSQLEILYDRVN
ncbi:hypothetical protein CR513_33764, partial [Mucuna pruriens]